MKRVRIGSVEFHVWQRCGRCTMTAMDRDSLERCGEPHEMLSKFRGENGQRNLMHLIPARPWDLLKNEERISVGDEVEILDEERRAEWMKLFGKKM